MAKKKQLAGKKTKLAKLPLTQVLAGRVEEPASWGSSSGPPPVASRPSPGAREGAGESLMAAYLQLVQELTALRSQLHPGAAGVPGASRGLLPSPATPPTRIIGALRQAREGLQDLHRLLSRP
jgi:hypothetical protein